MGKANWFYSARDNKWVLLGKGGAELARFNDSGLVDFPGNVLMGATGTLQNLNVGTLAVLQAAVVSAQGTMQNLRVPTLASVQALNVNAQGSVQNLNVGTLATLRALAVAAQGTIQDLNVPTLATLRSIDVGAVASIAGCDIGTLNVSGRFRIGAGSRFTGLERFVGTTEGIAAVGTLFSVWGTYSGSLSMIDSVTLIFASPRTAIGGNLVFGPWRCPTNGLINVLIGNLNPNSAGSLPADLVWDVFALKPGV